jgi:hypothetical protein
MFKYEDGAIIDIHTYGNLKQDLYREFKNFFESGLFSSSDINIEGLSFETVNNTLLIGFRSPVVNGKAILVAIENPKEIFIKNEKPKFSKPINLNLNGMGIRDITYDSTKDGYWIIAGSSNNRDAKFQLWYLDRKSLKVSLVKNHPYIGYGEGITIINKDSNVPSLLIVQDNGLKPNKSANYILIDRNSL